MNVRIVDATTNDRASVEAIVGDPVMAQILANRGVTDPKEIRMLIDGDMDDLHDPRLMKDAEKAADIIKKHILKGSEIVCYSDYDADGWGAAIVCVELIRKLGGKVNHFTNSRKMGYGANQRGVQALMDKFPNVGLVITTDNGIVAFDAIDTFNEWGIDVVVTDHHEPSADGRLPNAAAVVNPKRLDETYPFNGLCGAGVIFKVLLIAFYKMGRKIEEAYDVVDIVAVSTIGDVVPLLNENRILVKRGLKMINDESRIEWKILREVNSQQGSEISTIDSRTIGFTYAPQINACSRILGSIDWPLDLFLFSDEAEKYELAKKIRSVNEQRKAMTVDQSERAYTLANGGEQPVIVINYEGFDDGIVGIIAGRVKEAFMRPAIVLAKDEESQDVWKGSGRSIAGFPMKKVLDAIQAEEPILLGYGGHDMACGLSVKEENISKLTEALTRKANEMLEESDFDKIVRVDWEIEDNVNVATVKDALLALEPYGCEFEEPIVRIRNFKPAAIDQKSDGKHLFMQGNNFTAIAWHGVGQWLQNGSPEKVTAIGRLCTSTYGKYQLVCDPALVLPE